METPAKNKGGRPVGSMSKIASEAREHAKQTGLLPHEILLSMARGEPQTVYLVNPLTNAVTEQKQALDIDQRRDAAKAAAPYYAPKISTVEIIRGVEDEQLDAVIAELAAQAGIGIGPGREEPQGEDPPPTRTRVRIDPGQR